MKTYEDGLIEGRLRTLEKHVADHAERLRILERIVWVASGVAIFFQIFPSIQQILIGG